MNQFSQLQLFHGEATPTMAYVYARLSLEDLDGYSLSGEVRGPECAYSRTLPATFHLTDQGPGDSLLARAVIPDPCFWSPRLPATYQVRVDLVRAGEVVASTERVFGIRALGARRQHLFLEGKRWVVRGVSNQNVQTASLDDWREASAAMLVENPSDQLCTEALRVGVVLIAKLNDTTEPLISALERLACWPSVAIICIKSNIDIPANLRQLVSTTVLAQWFPADMPARPANWADAVACEVGQAAEFQQIVDACDLPVIAVRVADAGHKVAEARRYCDMLMRDLAPQGDFAGYIV